MQQTDDEPGKMTETNFILISFDLFFVFTANLDLLLRIKARGECQGREILSSRYRIATYCNVPCYTYNNYKVTHCTSLIVLQ